MLILATTSNYMLFALIGSVKFEQKFSISTYRGFSILQPSAFSVIDFEARGLATPCTNSFWFRMLYVVRKSRSALQLSCPDMEIILCAMNSL